jgi:hypothetical protein
MCAVLFKLGVLLCIALVGTAIAQSSVPGTVLTNPASTSPVAIGSVVSGVTETVFWTAYYTNGGSAITLVQYTRASSAATFAPARTFVLPKSLVIPTTTYANTPVTFYAQVTSNQSAILLVGTPFRKPFGAFGPYPQLDRYVQTGSSLSLVTTITYPSGTLSAFATSIVTLDLNTMIYVGAIIESGSLYRYYVYSWASSAYSLVTTIDTNVAVALASTVPTPVVAITSITVSFGGGPITMDELFYQYGSSTLRKWNQFGATDLFSSATATTISSIQVTSDGNTVLFVGSLDFDGVARGSDFIDLWYSVRNATSPFTVLRKVVTGFGHFDAGSGTGGYVYLCNDDSAIATFPIDGGDTSSSPPRVYRIAKNTLTGGYQSPATSFAITVSFSPSLHPREYLLGKMINTHNIDAYPGVVIGAPGANGAGALVYLASGSICPVPATPVAPPVAAPVAAPVAPPVAPPSSAPVEPPPPPVAPPVAPPPAITYLTSLGLPPSGDDYNYYAANVFMTSDTRGAVTIGRSLATGELFAMVFERIGSTGSAYATRSATPITGPVGLPITPSNLDERTTVRLSDDLNRLVIAPTTGKAMDASNVTVMMYLYNAETGAYELSQSESFYNLSALDVTRDGLTIVAASETTIYHYKLSSVDSATPGALYLLIQEVEVNVTMPFISIDAYGRSFAVSLNTSVDIYWVNGSVNGIFEYQSTLSLYDPNLNQTFVGIGMNIVGMKLTGSGNRIFLGIEDPAFPVTSGGWLFAYDNTLQQWSTGDALTYIVKPSISASDYGDLYLSINDVATRVYLLSICSLNTSSCAWTTNPFPVPPWSSVGSNATVIYSDTSLYNLAADCSQILEGYFVLESSDPPIGNGQPVVFSTGRTCTVAPYLPPFVPPYLPPTTPVEPPVAVPPVVIPTPAYPPIAPILTPPLSPSIAPNYVPEASNLGPLSPSPGSANIVNSSTGVTIGLLVAAVVFLIIVLLFAIQNIWKCKRVERKAESRLK